ncbi:MAG: alpha/beta hydrolase-fold protein [Spirosomataceae bacterium]
MKRLTLFCWSVLAICHLALAQHGKVLEGKTIKSTILGKDVRYSVYLPPDYETSDRKYPVVYLLHGYTDDDTGWLQFGEVNRYADKAIADGTIPPMIIVMPDGGVSWYINSYDGKVNYEDFFVNELIPFVEKGFRIRANKRFRGICGLSMGGHGSFIMALKHPDLFAAAAPLSAAIFSDDDMAQTPDDRYESVFGILYGKGLKGKDRLNDTWNKNSAIKLAQTLPEADLKKVRWWIDCGDDDFLINGNMALNKIFNDRKIPHEFRVREGAHTWTYWRTGIVEALQFIGQSFHQ